MKRYFQTWRGLNLLPPDHQLDAHVTEPLRLTFFGLKKVPYLELCSGGTTKTCTFGSVSTVHLLDFLIDCVGV